MSASGGPFGAPRDVSAGKVREVLHKEIGPVGRRIGSGWPFRGPDTRVEHVQNGGMRTLAAEGSREGSAWSSRRASGLRGSSRGIDNGSPYTVVPASRHDLGSRGSRSDSRRLARACEGAHERPP